MDSGSILGSFWVDSGSISRKPHQCTIFKVHLAVGRALALELVNIGVLGGSVGSTRYSPSQYPPVCTTPGTPQLPHIAGPGMLHAVHRHVPAVNSAVGLISVGQLSLSLRFSDLRVMTEVYNLSEIGNR